MSHPTIVLAEQDAIDTFPAGAAAVLDVLGHPEALVTDLSQVWDFSTFDPSNAEHVAREQQMLAQLSDLVGRPVTLWDYLWELARDTEAHRQRPTLQ